MDKAALRAMAYALNESLKKDGIYVGTVTVCDVIGKNSYYAPENIARDFYKLYETRSQVEIVH